MTISATKTVQIGRSAAESYSFAADPRTMPQWAIHNVNSIRELDNGRWEMDTPRGKATLIPHYEKASGILDHEFIDSNEGVWRVTARVVPVGPAESVYTITLPKPENMPIDAFEAGMRLMDDELAALKACIESGPAAPRDPTQIVEALYEGFRRRDMPKIFALLSPRVEIEQSKDLPWGGLYRGHEGARQFFGRLGAHINSTLAIERVIDSGDHVAAVGWTEGTVNATGAAYRVPIVHLWQIEDGQIARASFFIDHPAMRAALGPAGAVATAPAHG
jgi:ketosteroid isomerase-like protein